MRSCPSVDDLVESMSALRLLSGLEVNTLRHLATQAQWRRYQTGEAVVMEGQTTTGLYFLESGWLKVVKTSLAGREQILRFLEPGEAFNEIGVFTGHPTPVAVIPLEPAGVWWIPRRVLVQLVRQSPDFAEHMIAKMANNILHLVSLVADISLRTVSGRLARLILDDAEDGVLQRPRWYTQSELASRLGTVTDVIQRALRDLEVRSLIEVDRDRIVIIDLHRLREIAE